MTFPRFLGHRKCRRLEKSAGSDGQAYRTCRQAFKLEALELLARGGKSAAQLERELGITKGLLLKWRDRYQVRREQGEMSLAPSDLAAAQAAQSDVTATFREVQTWLAIFIRSSRAHLRA